MITAHLRRAAHLSMAFNSPPEVLFRNILRNGATHINPRLMSTSSQPTHFRAAVVEELGKPIVVKSLPMLQPSKSQILVKVEAAGINFADILKSSGQYQEKATVPYVPGVEICGHVASLGSDVTGLQIGQKIIGLSGATNGGFAEYCVLEGKTAIPVPQAIPSVVGASTLVSYGTAMMALTRMAKVKEGETVLVTAAVGATGMAILDIAANVIGAKVIAVCGGQEKCELAKTRGASYAIDYRSEDLRARVKEITGGKGMQVALDQVGGDIFMQCLKSIANEGRLVTIGYASGQIPSIPANIVMLKSCSVHGVFWGNTSRTNPPAFFKSIQDTLTALKKGQIKPYSGNTFPLDKVNEAFECVMSRNSSGKVVIVMT